ncbi:hypothetical protein K4K57_011445 [Colletotrichum sp. SAR 10_99]|nr:hypothetical protein K4K57_011445 [Colletotrichum sp. SAR 10_99]
MILQQALTELQRLEPKAVLATESKYQLISLNKPQLAKNPVVVKPQNERATCKELYGNRIFGETEDPLAAMGQYLQDMVDPSDPDEAHVPRFETSAFGFQIDDRFHAHRRNIETTSILEACYTYPYHTQ